ncbi:hypothetical protein [Aquipseudomonas ullengensis]|uniref:Uncharacterized protein n=1 Tax=Aquipseudomonas ullengensis TaxID=2759166 RepID=A0A7W4LNM1_9GAMM|nr:hypothetical protein [Pseudomonas ullengensis]MBB2496465.1 hypothetical protein [Pseudomonas ullengensis]
MGNRNNFSSWQQHRVLERRALVIDALDFLRKHKAKFDSITELANSVAEIVAEKECRVEDKSQLNPSTLLRRTGGYRLLLDAFIYSDLQYKGQQDKYNSSDPVANHLIMALKAENLNLKDKLCRKDSELKALSQKSSLYERANCNAVDASIIIAPMARVVRLLLDAALATNSFRFDSSNHELLYVGRARRVAVSTADLSPYLNYLRTRPPE